MAIDPQNAQALAYLGDIEWKANNADKAASLLNQALKINKDVRIAYVDLGAIYAQQEKYEEAQAALRHAIALDPAQADAHYQLARIYRTRGNNAAAEKELATVRELHKKADESLVDKVSKGPPELNPAEQR